MQEYFLENKSVNKELVQTLESEFGKKEYNTILKEFSEIYPSRNIYSNEITFDDYINDSTDGVENKSLLINEMILANLTKNNTSIDKVAYGDIFNTENKLEEPAFVQIFSIFNNFFYKQP